MRPADRQLLPPFNDEAEVYVIGALMMEPNLISEVAAIIQPEDFYADRHETLYRLILDIYFADKPVHTATMHEEILKRKLEGRVGGTTYFRQCMDQIAHTVNTVYFADVIRQYALARKLMEASQETIREVMSGQMDCDELIDAAERRIFRISSARHTSSEYTMAEVIQKAYQAIELRSTGEVTGLRTGFSDLDAMTGGIDGGSLVILAGRPSMGKTSLAMNIAENIASAGVPIYVASIEQSCQELGERMLSGVTGIDSHKFKGAARLSSDDWRKLQQASTQLSRLPIHVCDSSSQSASGIVSAVRRYSQKIGQPCVALVDHVGLVDVTGYDKREQRYQQLDILTRQLKALAKEVRMPVIVLSQLRREVTNREDKTPTLSDLRESGGLEQNADIVLLIHRPEYYDPDDEPGVSKVIVAKNRNGLVGTVRLGFEKRLTRFVNLDAQEYIAPATEQVSPF